MKRIGAFVCLMIMVASVLAPASFAENEANPQKTDFVIESSTPEDGAKGVSVENLSVKLYFSKEVLPKSTAVRKANAKEFKLTDKDGNKIPIKVYYSHKEKKDGLLMVVSDTIGTDIQIKGNTQYILTIGDGLKASDGTSFGKTETIKFRTLDQSRSTMVYTILMVIMMVGMVFFTSRSAKKAMEKENESKGKTETVNPYKEAKRTGKSVEEIVAKDQERKAKQAEARAKQRAAEAALEEDAEETSVSSNKRVSGPKPISAAGSQYKVKVVKTQKPENKGSANSKNQTGKQKSTGSKKNKKKK